MRLDGRSRGSIRSRVLESVDDQDLHHVPPRIQLQSKLLLKGRKDRGEVRVTRWRRRSGARSLLLGRPLDVDVVPSVKVGPVDHDAVQIRGQVRRELVERRLALTGIHAHC